MYMDNLTNKEPGIKDSTVQDSVSKEQKKKENRPVIGAKAQTILEFLRACSPYEADSIRVMVGYGMGKGDIETIEATDMLAVNRFLNHGLTCENGTSSEAVMKHRQERVQRLMEAVKGFVDIGQLCRISVALMKSRPTSRRWRMHGSTCNPNPPRTEGKTEIKPERTRKLSFTPFYRNRCKSFRRSVPLSPLNDTGKHEGQGNISFQEVAGIPDNPVSPYCRGNRMARRNNER